MNKINVHLSIYSFNKIENIQMISSNRTTTANVFSRFDLLNSIQTISDRIATVLHLQPYPDANRASYML